jgi:hypothetical protein
MTTTIRQLFGAVSVLGVLALGGCAWMPDAVDLLPSQVEVPSTGFESFSAVKTAYDRVTPGASETDLCDLGFDPVKSSNAEMLSYLGVIERFVPRDSVRFDTLPPAVRDCIDAQDHCQALVFHPSRLSHTRTGDFFMDFFGFDRVTTDSGWSADIVFLVRDHQVVYKIMSGRPYIADVHNVRQPLGPLQDFSNAIAAASMGAKF